MRRPLKPFVTEYKASNRRNSATAGEQTAFDQERSAPKPFDFMLKADSEDSFDAAMRAADALFSIPSDHKSGNLDQPDQTPPHSNCGDGGHQTSEKSGGRILRVLDEAPPPEYAALEAERAPKRRGRKPGSKNKPKVMAAVAKGSDRPPRRTRVPAARTIAAATPIPPLRKVVVAVADPAPPGPMPVISRQEKRFSWARDRLKPGEDWKRRRLPRVCW